MKSIKIILAGFVAILVSHANASAQVLTALDAGSPVIVNSVPSSTLGAPSPGTGTTGEAGYYFFDDYNETPGGPNSTGDVYSLPAYVTASDIDYDLSSNSDSANPTATFTTLPYAGRYSQLEIAGTEYGTGELYYNVASSDPIVDAPLLKITLGSGLPAGGDFILGLLHQDGDPTPADLTVYLYNSGGTLLSTADATGAINTASAGTNNFYYTEVSGAAATDYLVVAGSGHYQVTLGGITFDNVAAPEPSTYALMLAGLGFMLVLVRQRRSLRA
jgi:PEP-CTERM motif